MMLIHTFGTDYYISNEIIYYEAPINMGNRQIKGLADGNENNDVVNVKQYTLFQYGHCFSSLLFAFKLALVASFLNTKYKRIFSLERGNKS